MGRHFLTLLLVVIAAFFIRVSNIALPAFSADEARVAYRGYTMVSFGKDELGRSFPLLFNSLTDYQLPAVSYITALGELIFGKTEFGARIPFILLGIALGVLTYKISPLFTYSKKFWIISVLVLIFSPALIFLSKIPNESIVLTFLIALIFFLLTRDKPNIIMVLLSVAFSLMVSKFAWFIIIPFVIFTLLFYQQNLSKKVKVILSIFSIVLVVITVGLYMQVPQSKRSLSENNFSIFYDISIKNGINKLRGQGIMSGLPNFLEVILFNKSQFLVIGFLHWFSSLQPSFYFGQFDKTGQMGFSQMGALSNVLIIPFISGLVYLIRKGRKKERLLFVFFFILTYPTIFLYPDFDQSLLVLTLPFAAFIIAFGFMQFNRVVSLLIILIMILGLALNLFYLSPEKKNTNSLRPFWARELTQSIYKESLDHRIAVSDNIVEDIVSFIEWNNPVDAKLAYLDVPHPYRFRQTSLKNIKLIGSENELYLCKEKAYDQAFITKRDKDRLKDADITVTATYKDSINQEVVYLLKNDLCIR